MAVLSTGDITLPKTIADGMFQKAVSGSVVSVLSGAEPMQFGEVDIMTFDTPPKAEYVGEGSDKASSDVGFGSKTAKPHKVQVTMRFNEEVQWADEDHQLGVLSTLGAAGGTALARALDLGVIHRVNPLTGGQVSTIPSTDVLGNTTNVASVTTDPDRDVEDAAGDIIDDGFIPTGIAFDPSFAWSLSTARYNDGRKKYPELGLTVAPTMFEGLPVSTSSTVSGQPEVSDTGFRAIVGDWSLLRWGVQRRVPIELIRYGDPDNQGDLKRKNQIALRLEVVYGWVVLDLDGFAVVQDSSSS